MANIFLEGDHSEIETAILLEKAYRTDIGNAVAYTDGARVFVNTDDRLSEILPDYNKGMLKWLLWHEEYHMQLRHHNRFFKYLHELTEEEALDEFHVTKEEVNIIMDIVVHDIMSKKFPDLVETAITNLAQMRNRNSLKYTFKTYTLEEMLDEYAKHKKGEDGAGDSGSTEDKKEEDKKDTDPKTKETEETTEDAKKETHKKGGRPKKKPATETETKEDTSSPKDEHDKTDWSKLEDRDSEEFIDKREADKYIDKINELKRMKIKLGKLTQTLNGLATSTRERTYRMPSYIKMDNVILKGRLPGKTQLYLVFDASGSMEGELALFKDIIKKSIPQAMECPCEWFAGAGEQISPYKTEGWDGYYKGKFKDILPVYASSGFNDDGDRTIELCLEAEKKGYSPIGVTDGGGCIDRPEILKQLKRTILIGHRDSWLEKAKKINPQIKTLCVK